MRERRKGGGFHGDHPRAFVLPGNGRLGLEHAADLRNQLTEELPWGCRRRDTLRNLQKRAPLVGRQPPVPSRRVCDWGHRPLKSRVGKIFPPRLGIVGHEWAHSAQIQACT
jgi:hypothetical protein